MSELSIMFPEPILVQFGRREIKVFSVPLRHFELYGKCASEMVRLVSNASVDQISLYAQQNSKDVRKILKATTSLNRWQLWRLDAAVAAQLLAFVVRANSGFFVQALPAMVSALSGALSSKG